MNCPKCKAATVSDANFCHVCSQMLKPYCVFCKIDLPANANFCYRCAQPLSIFGLAGAELSPSRVVPVSQASTKSSSLPVKKTAGPLPSTEEISKRVFDSIPDELAKKFHIAQSSIASERKLVSIIFADLSGFTALSEKLDPEKITEIVNSCFQRLGKIIYEHEGYIDKFMGDCIMALFGAPIAHENDPELAVSAALKMLKELELLNQELNLELGMSIGINSGMVVAGGVGSNQKLEYTVMGDAVNVAQRLQSTAKRQQILVSKNIVKSCNEIFEFEVLPPVQVKGKEAPIEVFSVVGPKKVELKDRGIHSGFSKLIGREREIQIIEKLIDEASHGRGQILLLSGEPGVGKSRLKHEIKKMTYLYGIKFFESKCLSLNRETPYFVFTSLIQDILEIDSKAEPMVQKQQFASISNFMLEKTAENLIRDLLKIPSDGEVLSLSGEQKKKATFVAIRNLLFRAGKGAAVMIHFEDLHWLDPLSHELMTYIFDEVHNTSVFLAGSTRPDFIHEWSNKRNFNQISLGPLTSEQSLQLVKALLSLNSIPRGLEHLIETKTDGNPLYVEEIVKSLIDEGKIYKQKGHWIVAEDVHNVEVPQTLRGIIASRIDRLNENEKLVLQHASIIGRRFSDSLLAKTMGMGGGLYESLKLLRKRELIFEASSEIDEIVYMFNHALAQEVTYQSILLKNRKELHHKVAIALEELLGGQAENVASEKLEALAFHYVEAGVDEKAIFYLHASGKRMAESFNYEGALKCLLKAIELREKSSSPDSKPELFDLYFHASEVYMRKAEFDSAEKFQRKLLELDRVKADPSHLVKSHRRIGEISLARGHFDKAFEHFHLALDCAVKANDFEGQIRTYRGLANTWKRLNDFKKALEMFDKGVQGARTLGFPDLMAQYLNDKATVLIELQELDEARKDLEECVQLTQGNTAFKTILISATLNLGVVAYFQKNSKVALMKFQETAKLADQFGDLMNKLIAKHNIGEMLSESKHYTEALKEFEESNQIATDIGNDLERVNNQLLIGHTKTKMGSFEEGKKILETAITEAQKRKFWNYYLNGLLCLVDALSERGDKDQAAETLRLAHDKALELNNVAAMRRCEEEAEKLLKSKMNSLTQSH